MTVLQNTVTEPDGTALSGWLDVALVGNPFRAATQTEVLGPIKDRQIVAGAWSVDLPPGLYSVIQRRQDGTVHSKWGAEVPDSADAVWLADVLVEVPATPSTVRMVGIASADVDGAGHLQLTYTDGTTVDAGPVIGPQGPPYTDSAADFAAAMAAEINTPASDASVALTAASVAAVEDATAVTPAGAWDFAQTPTVGGVPVGSGGGGVADSATKSDLRNLLALGDSMTAGQGGGGLSYPGLLGSALGVGVTIVNRGQGGWTSTEIAVGAGAIDPTLGAFTIPAGTTPVTVTVTAPTGDFRAGGVGGETYSYVGVVAGVPGTLTHDIATAGAWTFTRATAGSSTPVAAGSKFHCTRDDNLRGSLAIIWAGRNNMAGGGDARIQSDIAAVVARLSPTVKRYLIIGQSTTNAETSGTNGYNAVVALNAALAATYGTQFLDVRRWLIDNGLAYNSITPTTQDNTDIAADTVPASLRSDGLHYNGYGYRALAQVVLDRLVALGWTVDARSPVPSAAPPVTNLYTDPSFELGTATFNAYAANYSMVRSTSAARTGSYGIRATFSGAGFTGPLFRFFQSLPGATVHSGSVWVRPSKTVTLLPQILLYNNNTDTFIVGQYNGGGKSCPAGEWTKLSLNGTVTDSGANIVAIAAANDTQAWVAGDYVDFDDVTIVDGGVAA